MRSTVTSPTTACARVRHRLGPRLREESQRNGARQHIEGVYPKQEERECGSQPRWQGRRVAENAEAADAASEAPRFLLQKEKEAGLAAAANAMLQHARTPATTARAVAVDNVRWRQARPTDAPKAYDGRTQWQALASRTALHSQRGHRGSCWCGVSWGRRARKSFSKGHTLVPTTIHACCRR